MRHPQPKGFTCSPKYFKSWMVNFGGAILLKMSDNGSRKLVGMKSPPPHFYSSNVQQIVKNKTKINLCFSMERGAMPKINYFHPFPLKFSPNISPYPLLSFRTILKKPFSLELKNTYKMHTREGK